MRPAAFVSTLRFPRRSDTLAFGDARTPARQMRVTPALRGACLGVVCASLIGCTAPPDLRDRVVPIDDTTPWPTLLTSQRIAALSTTQTTQASATDESVSQLAARAAALRARAARLTGPVLDPATRRRLQAASARNQ